MHSEFARIIAARQVVLASTPGGTTRVVNMSQELHICHKPLYFDGSALINKGVPFSD
jgi:hypothetical protein